MKAEKPGIMECVDAAFVKRRHGKHMSAAMDTTVTIELFETVFSVLSMPRLYNKSLRASSESCETVDSP
jgi:hypothetical protein